MSTAESASGSGWNVQHGGQNQQRRSQVGTAATGNPFLHGMSSRDLDKSSLILRFDSRLEQILTTAPANPNILIDLSLFST